MKKLTRGFSLLVVLCLFLSATASFAEQNPQPTAKKPKLILAVAVDQFRYEYLLRFRADYTAGFKKILENGAVFDDAQYRHALTVTAAGHSTFLSGATPAMSGIVGNEWYDRETKKTVTSVSDDDTQLIGIPGGQKGSSARRMLSSTLGDVPGGASSVNWFPSRSSRS